MYIFRAAFLPHEETACSSEILFVVLCTSAIDSEGGAFYMPF